MQLTISPLEFDNKPTDKDVPEITKSLTTVDDDFNNLLQCVSNNGNTFCPSVIERVAGVFSQDGFKESEIVCLDFDNEDAFNKKLVEGYLTPDQFINLSINEYGLFPSYLYETFSSKPDHFKFRVVYMLPYIIKDINRYKEILKQLMFLFPTCDEKCKNVNRLFFGSNKGLYYQDTLTMLNFELLQNNCEVKLKEKYKQHSSEHIGEICVTVYKNTIDANKDLPVLSNFNDIKQLQLVCPAFKDILEGKDFNHDIKWRILTNVITMPRIEALYKKALSLHSSRDWNTTAKAIEKSKYFKEHGPTYCSPTCPYYSQCDITKTINMRVRNKIKGEYIKMKDETVYKELEDVRQQIRKTIETIVSNKDGKIHVINSQCGVGKTYALKNLRDITLAFDRHETKETIHQEHFKYVQNLMITPRQPELPPDIQKRVNDYYNMGAFKSADSLIVQHANAPEGIEYVESRRIPLKGTVLTTHAKIFHNETENDTIVFDEDPINEMIQIDEVKVSDLLNFIDYLKLLNNDSLFQYFKQFYQDKNISGKGGKLIIPAKHIAFEIKEVVDIFEAFNKNNTNSSNLVKLLSAVNYFVTHEKVVFVSKRELPKNKTIIICSATISKLYAEYLFDSRLVWHETDQVKYKGNILQYVDKSFSKTQTTIREGLNKLGNEKRSGYNKEVIDDIKSNGLPTITFKDRSKLFNDSNEVPYFGAVTGLNDLIGKNINVVGTPRLPSYVVSLIASMFTHNINDQSDEAKSIEIVINNFKFTYLTYTNPILQAIDLNYTSSQLEQAVGRSRLINNDCNVNVFSHYPVKQTNIVSKVI